MLELEVGVFRHPCGEWMSQKWIRSKEWDDRHLTGVLWPVKPVLRAFSSIPLAIVLLVLVAIYGILASVPIGLLALIPTAIFYALTLAMVVGIVALMPTVLGVRWLRVRGVSRPARFGIGMLGIIGLTIGAVALWSAAVWPLLKFDPITGSGVRFFRTFVGQYQSVTLRRLPGVELSELEFYDAWPLRVVLLAFVVNMVTTTVRRIEFSFVNIGVLTVHTGIVTIALGSVYYSGHKQEGDMALLAGAVDQSVGRPGAGRPETGFYDNTLTALWVTLDANRGWEQRKLSGLPRYNNYNLDALGTGKEQTIVGLRDFGALDVRVPVAGPETAPDRRAVDGDIRFRVVGYSPYAELEERWVPTSGQGSGEDAGGTGLPLREVGAYMVGAEAAKLGKRADEAQKVWRLIPDVPSLRIDKLDLLAVEYTRGMSAQRWEELSAAIPHGVGHALVVTHPASGFRGVYAAEPGQSIVVGGTGYTITVRDVMAQPPFPIFTKGYEGSTSSVALVHVQPPLSPSPGAEGSPGVAFDRYVYHRFPEISQDLLDEKNEKGMPKRRDADPALRIAYIDASLLQVYLDEDPATGLVRSLVRLPGGQATVTPGLREGASVTVAPSLVFRLGKRSESVRRVELPRVVPEGDRVKERFGNHEAAVVAVEVSLEGQAWRTKVWVPFSKYLGIGDDERRTVRLPDGRSVAIAFGRVRHEFWPPMALRLTGFEMIPYPHSETPRDYRSELQVLKQWEGPKSTVSAAQTSLNDPLLVRTPFVAREDVPGPVNVLGRLVSLIAPNQYKFSQAGWDQGGWQQTAAAAARGELPGAYARFTILGVGNNPGISIIATGAVMMSLGIPWAFYIKPALLRRRKRVIQARLAREAGTAGSPAPMVPSSLGAHAVSKISRETNQHAGSESSR